MLDWAGTGCSVMEVSHRGKEFERCRAEAEADFRELLGVPYSYAVLFLHGGASMQWSQVLYNLCGSNAHGDFILTGEWTTRALAEGKRLLPQWGGSAHVVASSEDKRFSYIPDESTWDRRPEARFLHVCTNETIQGLEWNGPPGRLGEQLIVADSSSHMLSRPWDVKPYDLIYAGAQKNMGPAGLTIVIVKRELLGQARVDTPRMFDYKPMADNDSMLNTPPTFSIYLSGLIFKWIKRQGGVAEMERRAIAKSSMLYGAIDASGFYSAPVAKANRSRMNVPFRLRDESLDATFLTESAAAGLAALKGHKAVGGMRASLYNATGIDAVEALVSFMGEFERRYG
ncbi:3-phosphoserine/phosphohydroxythreonine transaminase [soil metagenome]